MPAIAPLPSGWSLFPNWSAVVAVVPALLDSVGVDSRAMGAAKTILIHNDKSLLRQWLCIYRLLPHRLCVAAAPGRMLLLLVPDGELWVDVSYDSYMFPFLFSVGPLFSISFPLLHFCPSFSFILPELLKGDDTYVHCTHLCSHPLPRKLCLDPSTPLAPLYIVSIPSIPRLNYHIPTVDCTFHEALIPPSTHLPIYVARTRIPYLTPHSTHEIT